MKKFLNLSKKRINKFIKILNLKDPPKINYLLSDVNMTSFQGRISTEYKSFQCAIQISYM